MILKDKLLEAAKKTECGGCATEWVNTIFDAIGSCETCRHQYPVGMGIDPVPYCVEMTTTKLPGYCGHYKPKESA